MIPSKPRTYQATEPLTQIPPNLEDANPCKEPGVWRHPLRNSVPLKQTSFLVVSLQEKGMSTKNTPHHFQDPLFVECLVPAPLDWLQARHLKFVERTRPFENTAEVTAKMP